MKSRFAAVSVLSGILTVLPILLITTSDPTQSYAQGDFSCADVTEIPQAECESLVALYDNTDGPNWANDTDWLSTNTPCSWHGVNCYDGHVLSLLLSSNQLSGTIPSELSNLANLKGLYLYVNQLTGPIPPEVGDLASLQHLNLSNNQLTGAIPSELGNLANLQSLYLYVNQITGTIPSVLGDLASLQYLSLSLNELAGAIPPEVGNLSNLKYLNLSHNQLTDVLPPELGHLAQLEDLYVNSNLLTGALPGSLANLGNLSELRFNATSLCEPTDSAFQAWLSSIATVVTDDVLCPESSYFISGKVQSMLGGSAIPGVHVSAGPGNWATTNASGAYTITALVTGTYTLAPTKDDYAFSPLTRTVSLPPPATGQDFAEEAYVISGRTVMEDGAPIPGVTVSIMTIRGLEVTQATQDLNNTVPLVKDKPTIARAYVQANASRPMDYASIALQGSRNGTPLPGSPFIIGPQTAPLTPTRASYDSSFNAMLPASWLSGTVMFTATLDPGTQTWHTDISDGDGVYSLTLPVGTYTLTPVKRGHTFSPASQSITVPFTEKTVNFTATLPGENLIYLPLVRGAESSRAYDPDVFNDRAEFELTFTEVPALDLKIVPYAFVNTETGMTYQAPDDQASFKAIADAVVSAFPVSTVTLSIRTPITVEGPPQLDEVLYAVIDLRQTDGAPASQIYYGVGGNILEMYYAGLSWPYLPYKRTSVGRSLDIRTAQHEIGHNLGLIHSCSDPNYPYPGGSIGEYGLETSSKQVYTPANTKDIMGTDCPYNPDFSLRWFSDYSYRILYEDQLMNGAPVQASVSDSPPVWVGFDIDGSLLRRQSPQRY
jgi:hypothetical protein